MTRDDLDVPFDLPDTLDQLVSGYFEHRCASNGGRAERLTAADGDVLGDWLEAVLVLRDGPAPDAAWDAVVTLIERAPDPEARSYVAAGPLADLLVHHGAQFADRLVTKTRQDPGFRLAVSEIHHWERVPSPVAAELQRLTNQR